MHGEDLVVLDEAQRVEHGVVGLDRHTDAAHGVLDGREVLAAVPLFLRSRPVTNRVLEPL